MRSGGGFWGRRGAAPNRAGEAVIDKAADRRDASGGAAPARPGDPPRGGDVARDRARCAAGESVDGRPARARLQAERRDAGPPGRAGLSSVSRSDLTTGDVFGGYSPKLTPRARAATTPALSAETREIRFTAS